MVLGNRRVGISMLGSKYVANVIGMRTRTRTSYYVLLWDEVCMEPKIDIPKSSVVLLARTLGQAGRDRRGTTCTCPRGEHHPQGNETEGQYPYRAEHVLLARAVWPNAHEACTRHVKTGICSPKSCKKKFKEAACSRRGPLRTWIQKLARYQGVLGRRCAGSTR